MGSPFARVGITGYPESHPKIEDDITVQAMWDKRRHATYIVSNLCFDPATLRQWIIRVRARGVTLPLLVGLAGPVERARLMQDGGEDRRGRLGPVPGRAHRVVPPAVVPGAYSPSGCSTGSAVRSPTRPQPSRACTSSRSTRSGRPSSGAGDAGAHPGLTPVLTVPCLRCRGYGASVAAARAAAP